MRGTREVDTKPRRRHRNQSHARCGVAMKAGNGEVPVCHGRRAVDPHVAYAKAAQVRLQV